MRCPVAAALILAFAVVCAWAEEPQNTLSPIRQDDVFDSYYGVCAHIGCGDPLTNEKLAVCAAAHIRWVRADFTWSFAERPQGTWHFEAFDALLEKAQKYGIEILPILVYNAEWATPAHEHLDEWTNYVRTLVTRYQDRLRCWEVWNEPNLKQFWHVNPDGAAYKTLLEASYKTIKGIDPGLTVVYGGLAGVPMEFLTQSLDAGAAEFFDVMNIHPYRGGFTSVQADNTLARDIQAVSDLIKNYTDVPKPIWITEMGWSTLPGYGQGEPVLIAESLAQIFADRDTVSVAMLDDARYPGNIPRNLDLWGAELPKNCRLSTVTLDDLKGISPKRFDALMMQSGETFPTPWFDDLIAYVKNGGTIIFSGGVPLYYEIESVGDGWENKTAAAPEEYRRRMRIGWKAWWQDASVPEITSVVCADALLEGKSDAKRKELSEMFKRIQAGRFFTDEFLTENDTMIPMLNGAKDDFSAPCAVIYRFNSDWTGNLVVSSVGLSWTGNVSTDEDQGVFLAQAMLVARAAGVEKYFWYELQATEHDPTDRESFFGIVHADLSPKPGYIAYQALTQAAPDGSSDFCRTSAEKIETVTWRRPDNKHAAALWSPSGKVQVQLKFSESPTEAFDLSGNPIQIPATGTVELSPNILYIIGPEKIEIQ